MAGIYIHIPFCKKACHYCNFHFSTSLGLQEDLVSALINEIELQKDFLMGANIETIYFGGGTPSILSINEIVAILNKVLKEHKIESHPEITLEANPDDLTKSKLIDLAALGINRLSIGIQSFHEEDLQWMNRSHNVEEAKNCIAAAQDVGIDDLSIDLIFGSNTTTESMWKDNLDTASSFGVPHISAYGLTVEEGTALAHHIATGKSKILDNKLGAAQFTMTSKLLSEAGYEHYEISNYAKDQKYSRHNTNYWKQVPYLGIGPAAHSYDGENRQWNIANNKKYIDALANQKLPSTKEQLSPNDKFNEYILTGLRTMWGCDKKILNKLNPNWESLLQNELAAQIENAFILSSEDKLVLSPSGKLIADTVMSQLFLTS